MPEFTVTLIHDLSELLQQSDEYNIIIEVGEKAELKKFQAHSVLLRARSPYFRRALPNEWAKKRSNIVIFKKPNIASKIFEIILRYMYTGVVNLNQEKGEDVLQLLIVADELELFELINHAQEHLINNESKWLQENIVKTMQTISCHEPFEKLKDYYFKMVDDNPHFIFKSNDFLFLEESILASLLQRDGLRMEEIDVWQSLIKWGIGNTPRLVEKKLVSWGPEDFAALEKTIHKCIPLIRYYDISGDDYFEYVIPYKKILPKNFRKEIWAHHLKTTPQPPTHVLPHRNRFAESRIINSEHINIISSWIDKNFATTNYKSPYTFKLIYRGSRDGFVITSFQDLFANQVKILAVAKMTASGNIVGGYNPTCWGENQVLGYDYDYESLSSAPDSFIFNFGNGKNPALAEVAYSTSEYQIVRPYHDGLYFSEDLFFGDNCNMKESCWYQWNNFETQIFDTGATLFMFQLDELELFHVIE
ncbi:hypothetical protein G9A89_009162 [Geosiphon pyriformis]|nr:hypothetical protein G9A89_009162 [Geosiphon pyriformis]